MSEKIFTMLLDGFPESVIQEVSKTSNVDKKIKPELANYFDRMTLDGTHVCIQHIAPAISLLFGVQVKYAIYDRSREAIKLVWVKKDIFNCGNFSSTIHLIHYTQDCYHFDAILPKRTPKNISSPIIVQKVNPTNWQNLKTQEQSLGSKLITKQKPSFIELGKCGVAKSDIDYSTDPMDMSIDTTGDQQRSGALHYPNYYTYDDPNIGVPNMNLVNNPPKVICLYVTRYEKLNAVKLGSAGYFIKIEASFKEYSKTTFYYIDTKKFEISVFENGSGINQFSIDNSCNISNANQENWYTKSMMKVYRYSSKDGHLKKLSCKEPSSNARLFFTCNVEESPDFFLLEVCSSPNYSEMYGAESEESLTTKKEILLYIINNRFGQFI